MATGDPRQVRAAMRAMETHLQGMVEPAGQQLQNTEYMIRQMSDLLEETTTGLNRALDRAEDALAYCESLEDRDGRRPDCSSYYRRVQDIRRAIAQVAAMSQRYERSVASYQTAAAGLREVITQDIPQATHWLRDRERALEKFESDSVGISSSSSSPSKARGSSSRSSAAAPGAQAGSIDDPGVSEAFHDFFRGMGKHGAPYVNTRQTYLRENVPNDPNQAHYIRGWSQQEKNRLAAVERARAAGLRPPGGDPRKVRVVPGLQTGHDHYGLDHEGNYHLQEGSLNKIHYFSSKRLGLDRLYR